MTDPTPSNTIIVKKVVQKKDDHGSGAWKIALADMMTAMMAFFLVLWLISSTDDATLSGIADQFKKTKDVDTPKNAGSDGLFGGESIIAPDEVMPEAPAKLKDTTAKDIKDPKSEDIDIVSEELISDVEKKAFEEMEKKLTDLISRTSESAPMLNQVEFIREKEGMRIQIVDNEDTSMFSLGTDVLEEQATSLLSMVASVINSLPNKIMVRGHTDARAYSINSSKNNWILSSERAEATRAFLQERGISPDRFVKVEGVSDVDPYILEDLNDPRNRRISIILKYQIK